MSDVTGDETELCVYIYNDAPITDSSVVSPEDASLQISSGSKLRVMIDSVSGTTTKYYYDAYGNIKETWTGNVREIVSERDSFNRATCLTFINGESVVRNRFTYKNNYSDAIASETVVAPAGNTDIAYTQDALNRITSIKTVQSNNGYKRAFAYVPRGASASPEGTTGYIESISYYNVLNNAETLEKTENVEYNSDGNISAYGDNTYVYDRIGRLVRENNKALDKTYVFVYNEGGNIVSKTEYVYTTGELGEAAATYAYEYANAWKDQLTSYGGNAITYDGAGNPTSYMGNTLTWSKRGLKNVL